jgi:6-pyruvoyltetrahydropterin/6-carboxytetrahydropterin synthase
MRQNEMAGFSISKDFQFSASHILSGLVKCHPCSQLHGHNYIVRVTLHSKKLNDVGFVQDYRELSDIKEFIDDNLDHRHLNDVMPFNPTAENIAKYLFDIFKIKHPLIKSIGVSETGKTWATYEN